jgi:predicted nucleic acid-binding protein
VSQHVIGELQRTLAKPYFASQLTSTQTDRIFAALQHRAFMTAITVNVAGITAHPEDDLVLATAVSASAGCVVTGDAKFQAVGRFGGVEIVSPRAFLDILAQSAP